ncbi:methyltransferase, putative [Trichomonas vaginalis G3]|uniref:Arsenite methyltransferase n=1 Tax=Trichomonas vaginalis (strain ATCC PRA-98 / G3) TaxID=412133 RepID=A2DVE6_TRIV3|nr:arsonoacetate metabolic process [Trichomonas vaginalis G3]EAY15625.1 methyltransferase, putative [Trichomonas vaginalis G3]KAI5530231.1 arsonoacetate metabolic process [Trichomonas vaginalis G3]|eukprot:XP_001327848.1 methyltransferase [Trichomonas vaginalis G3]
MHEQVSEYYGKTIKKTEDLKYEACVVGGEETKHHKQILAKVSPKVIESFYGCGSPIPDPLEGTISVDLGSGTGRDCFVISALAGKTGHVIGVDMTQEQIDVANEAIAYHKEHIPEASPIEFRKGFIEDLHTANIPDNFADVVVSNCVINLSPQKKNVFKEIYRVLKDGGELHFSDVFSDRSLPKAAREDKVLVGECIGNAMDINTFIAYMLSVGFKNFRVVTSRVLNLPQFPPELIEPGTVFWSITISAFKGVNQPEWKHDIVVYKGGIPGSPEVYKLDSNHSFKVGEKVPVYSNIAEILSTKRYSPFFDINKDETREAPDPVPSFMEVVFASEASNGTGCCCCGSGNCC